MTETMLITVSLFFALYLYADAQTTVSLKAIEGDDVTLSCTLSGTFTLPFWQGPPSLTPYTIQDAVDEAINPAAPAASRLQFASNKKDLVLSNANISDIGSYKCSYTGIGEHTITLSVTAKGCKCECDCMCRTIVIVSMVFGIPGALGLLIVIVGLLIGCFDEKKTTLLVFDGIGIVSDVLSLILSIVVIAKECCKASENCEDSECCKEDSECCKDWIDNAAIAFIAIPCVAIVVSVVIFVLVKLDIIGPGSNAYKAKEAKDPGENHGMTGTSM